MHLHMPFLFFWNTLVNLDTWQKSPVLRLIYSLNKYLLCSYYFCHTLFCELGNTSVNRTDKNLGPYRVNSSWGRQTISKFYSVLDSDLNAVEKVETGKSYGTCEGKELQLCMASLRRWHLNKDLKEKSEWAICVSGGRASSVERITNQGPEAEECLMDARSTEILVTNVSWKQWATGEAEEFKLEKWEEEMVEGLLDHCKDFGVYSER